MADIKIVDVDHPENVWFEGTLEEAKEWCWQYHMVDNAYKFGWKVEEKK